MSEHSLIAKYFAPLASNFTGSLSLTDDAALLAPPAGHELVITKDALTAGVHFLGSEEPALMARKALRTNLSDLAGMGATPLCYFLAIALPKDTSETWFAEFANGLAYDQKNFGISLAGGDTISTLGTLTISITAIGTVPTGSALKRSTAQAGDDIYVSGTLGDSALGLVSLKENKGIKFFEQRYFLPQPRMALGEKLRGVAHAAMDISDGLLQDLGHICAASKLGATLYADAIPLSAPAAALEGLKYALSGGDDYELLFTAPSASAGEIEALAASLSLPLTRIGEMTAGDSVKLLDGSGNIMTPEQTGFSHF